jgi:phosphomannomutase
MKINKNIFREYDIRGKYPKELDESSAYALGLAFAKMTGIKKIVVGRDARLESEKVFWPLVEGLIAGGLKIYDLGVCATPELFFSVGEKKFPGGVMVTASHSPGGETGFKFCDGRGRVFGLKTGLKKLQKIADASWQPYVKSSKAAKSSKTDFISITPAYKKFVLSFIKLIQISGQNIILDASSGAGARLADTVFSGLPLKTTYINFRAHDRYPDHGFNPLLAENQTVVSAEVKKQRADLGVIFDGDADRAVFIDEYGNFVQPYYINCLLAEIILKLKKKITIVVDARLDLAIAQTIKKNNGKILSHRSGYANFIHTMSAKKLLFGCENSGHFMLNFSFKKKSSYVYGDAIIPVLLVLKYLKENKIKLSQAVKKFQEAYVISGELNFPVSDFALAIKKLKSNFKGEKFSELDGLSVWGKKQDWFFNLRPSKTEPVIRLNIEARNDKILAELKNKILIIIK